MPFCTMIENGLKNPFDQHGYSSRKSYLEYGKYSGIVAIDALFTYYP